MLDNEYFIPSERLRVFISSAQSNENGFAWSAVRRRIKDCLSQCKYLNPFIIEDVASSVPSLQFFQRQVEHTDVFVILVKGDVRDGTATEYALATKLKKPLFVYFLEEERPNLNVTRLKLDLQSKDRCTYHPVKNFDDIEFHIRNDIIEDVIRCFQDKYYDTVVDDVEDTFLLAPDNIKVGRIPSISDVEQFDNCEEFLFDLLGIEYFKDKEEKQETNKFGEDILRWIITGDYQLSDSDISMFIEHSAGMFSGEKWLYKRWDAIRQYHLGNINEALKAEEEALNSAKRCNEPSWIINDILIDCRNLELENANVKDIFLSHSKYQEELSNQEFLVCLPVLDRYKNSIYEQINKDETRINNSVSGEMPMSIGIASALIDYANYVFSAAIYGSNTHLMLARKILSQLMQRYSGLTNNRKYAFIALKSNILAGDVKSFEQYINRAWDLVYASVTDEADELWKLTNQVPVTYRDAMKQAVIQSLGMYFTDVVFNDVETYLSTYKSSVNHGNSERFFKTILGVLQRTNPERVLNAIIPIIREKRYIVGNKLSHIIMYIDYEKVNKQTLINLNEVLKLRLADIIKNNGDPQMIAILIQHNKEIFGGLESLPGNGLDGIQELLFKINLGSENWLPVLQSEIGSARTQFEANSQKGVFLGFGRNPYPMISRIVRDSNTNNEIDLLIKDEFIPLAIDVLNSEAAVSTKAECLACLLDVLSSFERREIPLPAELIETIRTVDIQKGTDFFHSFTRRSLEIMTLMAKVQSGIVDVSGLLQWCIVFNKLTIREKADVIDCIEKYLYQTRKESNEIESLIVSIILQCVTETDSRIRSIAYRCISYIIDGKYQEIAIKAINQAVFDPAYRVRSTLLDICKRNDIPKGISERFITTLANDANYMIRNKAIGIRNNQYNTN